jgi:hypothetical protein
LLSDRNDSAGAAYAARAELHRLTSAAAAAWVSDRVAALTFIGKACHIVQDSFSEAHTVRTRDDSASPGCVRKLKAYVTRAPGFDTPDIEYHGADATNGIGHTTTLDSVYRPGRDCHHPATAEDVERCLSPSAQRARRGTRDYLAVVRRALTSKRESRESDEFVGAELAAYAERQLQMCP